MAEPGEEHDGGVSNFPYCPVNGHSWRCNCTECTLFWRTPQGDVIHLHSLEWKKNHG